ncbi:hypothetical protein NL676_012342 [Syzygium grande]|nr:hypothetical protein NL676_012342 [Syzygium grande]
MNKFDWFSRGFNLREPMDANANKHGGYLFTCAYDWRLNMEIGEVRESNFMGTEFSMYFPFINANLTGLRNKCGYAQVINSKSSSECGVAKYGNLVKLYFDEPCPGLSDSERGLVIDAQKFEGEQMEKSLCLKGYPMDSIVLC